MTELTAGKRSAGLGFDLDALRERYRAERDRRIRPDGSGQYQRAEGRFGYYADDPYAEDIARAPLDDRVDVVVVGGGFGGLMAAARLRQVGVERIRVIERGGDFGGTWYWNRSVAHTTRERGRLDRPGGLDVRADGTLVVAETGAGRVVLVTGTDAGTDTVTVLADGFAEPVDVAVDGDVVYVSDAVGAVFRVADGPPTPVATDLLAPQGIAVLDGVVYVVETGTWCVLALDPATGERRIVAEDLPLGGPEREQPALFTHGLPGVPRSFAGLAAAGGALLLAADGVLLALDPIPGDDDEGNPG